MRWWALAAIFCIAACDDDSGARLVLHAPDGPSSAASFRIVLASPDLVPVIDGQRANPRTLATETVTYFLQRATAGTSSPIPSLQGYTILVKPNAQVADHAFIPFVLFYDDAQALSAIGTYHADTSSPSPSPILVENGSLNQYFVDVQPVEQVDQGVAVMTEQAQQITCRRDDGSSFASGIVWRPLFGEELRIVLPSVAGTDDATTRALDLDCDGHPVTPSDTHLDCDDTRGAFYLNAPEACDGENTGCTDLPYFAEDCGVPTCNGYPDIALCDDTTGTVSACQTDPACVCASGTGVCTRCTIAHGPPPTASTITPCQPGIGTMSTQNLCSGGAPCTVEVVGTRGGWAALVAQSSTTAFGNKASGVGSSFLLEAKRPEGAGATILGVPAQTTGEVFVNLIDPSGSTHLLGIELRLDEVDTQCIGGGPYAMNCQP